MAEQDQDPKTPVSKAKPDLRNNLNQSTSVFQKYHLTKNVLTKPKVNTKTLNKSEYKYNLYI